MQMWYKYSGPAILRTKSGNVCDPFSLTAYPNTKDSYGRRIDQLIPTAQLLNRPIPAI